MTAYVVTYTSPAIDADSPDEAISRADEMSGGHWEAEEVTPTPITLSAWNACHAWAAAYVNMWDMADGFHEGLNLSEAVALADILAAAGRGDLAATLIRGWGIGDPEMVTDYNDNQEDPHYIARLIYNYGDPIGEYADGLPWLPPRSEVSGL